MADTILGVPVVICDERTSKPLGITTISLEAAHRLKMNRLRMKRIINEIMAAYGLNDLGMTELVERYG